MFGHSDHLGSATVTSDEAGQVVEETEYLPFGGMRAYSVVGGVVSNYKFTDQEIDQETNLYNYDARMYDPAIGLFNVPDSIDPDWYDPQSLNRYAYCRNNPLVYVDPTGESASEWADQWDSWKFETEKWLDQMVGNHTWSWPAAATLDTCMDVGAGFVDVLRLGEGSAEGGWGYGKDLLRGFGIASFGYGGACAFS